MTSQISYTNDLTNPLRDPGRLTTPAGGSTTCVEAELDRSNRLSYDGPWTMRSAT
jgi:hypothetical protein